MTKHEEVRAAFVEHSQRLKYGWLYILGEHTTHQLLGDVCVLNPQHVWAGSNIRIDQWTKIEGGEGIVIGDDVHIASLCHIGIGGGMAILESGSCYASGAKIITGSNMYGRGHGCSAIDPKAVVKRSFVHVKKNASIFSGAVVLPGVTIGENAVIGANAVVIRDVPDYEIWAGNPARKVKDVT